MKNEDIREITLTGLKEKFSGASGKLYPLEEGRILKVYNPNYPKLLVERLVLATELIRKNGILTPEIFERVTCEGKHGIIFQYLSGIPLGHIFLKEDDEEREKIARKMGRILRQFHSIKYEGNELTVMSEMFQGILDRIDQEFLNSQQRKSAKTIRLHFGRVF